MNYAVIQRILSVLLILFSLTLIPPMGVSVYYQDGSLAVFVTAFVVLFSVGLLSWLTVRHAHRELMLRDGFIVVAMAWISIGLSGALPFMLAHHPHMNFTAAVFESISGLTTTGATVLTGLDTLPRSILYYRQQLHWFGGMGIIVLALAVFPMLGVGGMQLYRAETPGPIKDKITPRVTETAKALWLIYLGITVACALSYWAAGMPLFDAIGNSYATVATGGFSMHDASFAYYHSDLLNLIAAFFMFASGVNFALHYVSMSRRSIKSYFRDPEFRAYLTVFCIMVTGITVYLYTRGTYHTAWRSFVTTVFQVASMSTSTGFTATNFSLWPGFVPLLLILIGFMGACAGSTTGGIKTVRFLLMFKQGKCEVLRAIHPSAEVPLKLGKQPVSGRVIDAVWGFVAVYVLLFMIMFIILMATDLDPVSAFSGLATCMNGVGPALGTLASNFIGTTTLAKWVFISAMLLGRLEIYPILVLLSPAFWKR